MTDKTASVAEVKRFLELWTSGSAFRQALNDQPSATLARYHLEHLNPEELRPLYDPALAGKNLPTSPLIQAYRTHIQSKFKWRDQIRLECAPTNEIFQKWRERQIARCQIELGPNLDAVIIHTPLAIELAVGCSVQCWFCSLDAPPLKALFPYTESNAQLWQEMLATLRQEVGTANKWGCVYWACEPMDNPDYERFCDDFSKVFSLYPQTTTAAPMRDPERTRALLVDSFQKGCLINRFSVNSLSTLDRIIETFTADELATTELILQNNEADGIKAEAGRSTRHFKNHPAALLHERQKIQEKSDVLSAATGAASSATDKVPMPGTTSCVSGFLINMVEKRVQLISPCYACERWPLGYMIFDEEYFTDTKSFQSLIQQMISKIMIITLPENRPLKFASCLNYSEIEDGFTLTGRYQRLDCKNPGGVDYLRSIGKLLQEGTHSAGAISIMCSYQFGVADALTRGVLSNFFLKGMLDEGL